MFDHSGTLATSRLDHDSTWNPKQVCSYALLWSCIVVTWWDIVCVIGILPIEP